MKKLDAEVGVVGLGTMGSMALWRSAVAGATTIGFEARNVGHDRAGAGGETRWFRANMLEPYVLDYVRLSATLYRELESQVGTHLLNIKGALLFGAPDSVFIRNVRALARVSSRPLDMLNFAQVRDQYPQHRIKPSDIALWDPYSGYVRSEFSVVAATRAAVSAGAKIHEHSPVTSVRQRDGYVEISARERTFKVRRAILSAGSWTHRLTDLSHATPDVRRLLLMWFPALDPAAFLPEVFPTWAIETPSGAMAFGMPTLDGGSVKVAVVESYGEYQDPDNLDYSVHPDELLRATELVRQRFAGLVPTVVRASAHMDLHTLDNQPVVDFALESPDIFVASGFSGKGFKYAPAVGEAAARAVSGDHTMLRPEWAASRFSST